MAATNFMTILLHVIVFVTKPARFARPLAGAAIAATVALAALLGLQNLTDVPEGDSPVGNNTFAGAVEVSYTVPEQEDDLLREYYLRHNASSSSIGINSVNSRLVTLQLRDGVVVEHDTAEEASDDEPAESEAAEAAESTAP